MQKNTPLETMYMEYANTVKHFLISLCGNFDLAEDLTQETFYQAYKSAHRYNGNCKISVWLCQIAKHLYFDYLKKEKHKTTVGIEHLESFEAVNNQGNLEDTYLIKEETKELIKTLDEPKYIPNKKSSPQAKLGNLDIEYVKLLRKSGVNKRNISKLMRVKPMTIQRFLPKQEK